MRKTHKRFIKCSQKITYYQQVELTDEELDILENCDELNICEYTNDEYDRKAYDIIVSKIDPNEVFEAEREYSDFELLKK